MSTESLQSISNSGLTNFTENIGKITKNITDQFAFYIITVMIIIILIFYIIYLIYVNNLSKTECNNMNNLYSSVNGNIKSINSNNPDCSGNLCQYYIKTAYNACSGGNYTNDVVDICNLKAVLKTGARCLDFEIYSINNQPVVATSIEDSYYVKQTYNSVDFSEVMSVIQSYAFASGTAPNYTDPLIIHLRIKSNNQNMYTNLASIFKSYDSLMLGKEYSFENQNTNFGNVPLLKLTNKIVLIVDGSNKSYLDNNDLLEYINITSNSAFMYIYDTNTITNDIVPKELIDHNISNMSLVVPSNSKNPQNPSGLQCYTYGCQFVAMRYQLYGDNNLAENNTFFNEKGYAFVVKPPNLRNPLISNIVPAATPQNPAYSYETRNVTTDYYSFNF